MFSYRYCPYCSTAYTADQTPEPHKHCQACSKSVFMNPKATANAMIIHEEKLLLVRRAIEPSKGMLDLPGGFCEWNEHPQETVVREMHEELGVEFVVDAVFGIYGPNPYHFEGSLVTTIDVTFLGHLTSHDLSPQDDVASIEWFPLKKLPHPDELAFPTIRTAIDDLRQGHMLSFFQK